MSKRVSHETLRGRGWGIWADNEGNYANDQVMRSIALDIRHELQKLNAVMQCPNVTKGFRALASIAREEKAFKRRVQAAVRRELRKRGIKP